MVVLDNYTIGKAPRGYYAELSSGERRTFATLAEARAWACRKDGKDMGQKHTLEPWGLGDTSPTGGRYLIGGDDLVIAELWGLESPYPDTDEEAKANAARIVACVNALAGMDPEKVGDALKAYRALHNGLSDMVKSGRLAEADIPDDYQWLVTKLMACVASDPEGGK